MTTMHTPKLYDIHMSAEISRSRAEAFAAVARGVMFLFLGIAALVFATPASAEQLGYIPNQAGGRIYVTDTDASHVEGCESALIAYTTTSAGEMQFGCWVLDGDNVVILWGDGKMSAFLVADFILPDHKAAAPMGLRYDL